MSLSRDDFGRWLSSKRDALDSACAVAMLAGGAGVSGAHLEAANKTIKDICACVDSGMPMPGGDCNYQQPGVGVMYTGHFHCKRIHDSLSILLPLKDHLAGRHRDIIEIGAGTGAVLWAWALVANFAAEHGTNLPRHRWISLDSSQDMLQQSDRLWMELCGLFPRTPSLITRDVPLAADWRQPPDLPTNAVLIGSFLFSREDAYEAKRTAAQMAEFLNRIEASGVILWTKENKRRVLDCLKGPLRSWTDSSSFQFYESPLCGWTRRCIGAAQKLYARKQLKADDQWHKLFNWGGGSTKASVLFLRR